MKTVAVQLGNLTLEHPIMNGAGTCKIAEFTELLNSNVAAIVVGSITKDPRPGNEGTTYFANDTGSLNSLGIPNPGADYYRQHLPAMVKQAHAAGKLLFLSVAGFAPVDFLLLTELAADCGVDCVELNLGCPNIWEGGAQKRIASFDLHLVSAILTHVESVVARKPINISLKVSPFTDPSLLETVAREIRLRDLLAKVIAVTTMNTVPNALILDADGQPCITPAGGLGGYAGAGIKPIGLGQVRQWRQHLPDRIQVIGVGGIQTGRDVWEYLHAGATAVQVVTAYCQEGKRVFERILTEYIDLVVATESAIGVAEPTLG